MAEKKFVLKGLSISYEGLFDIKAFYKFLEKFIKDYGYQKNEVTNEQKTHKTGKDIYLFLEPYRTISYYAKNFIQVKISIKNLKDVEIVKDNKKVKMNDAKVSIEINSYLKTDTEGRWEHKPLFVFFRGIMEKYVYKIYMNSFEKKLEKDTRQLYNSIKSFFNLYKY